MSIVSNTACNLISDPDLLTPSSSRSAAQTETSKTETTTSETSETTTESESGYNLSWSNFDSKEFDKYVQEKCNGQTLASYINLFGFTDELPFMGCVWWILALLAGLVIVGYLYLIVLDIRKKAKKAK